MLRSLFACLAIAVSTSAQRQSGELRITVVDSLGAPLVSEVQLSSDATQTLVTGATDERGRFVARNLPFGPYRLSVARSGFAPRAEILTLQSEAPVERNVTLEVAGVATQLVIEETGTLLDPHRTGTVFHVGREMLQQRRSAVPGRGVLELINRQPGWLLEANGVLHPRGSEYDTQYVIDGIPILDNRSPAFAPAFEAEELSAMRVMTGGYPAEYGRKLGGVVELVTRKAAETGFHGRAVVQGGSFDTQSTYLSGQYVRGRNALTASGQGARTSRFLDPPVVANLSNRATSVGGTLRWDYEPSDRDRLRFYFHRKRTGFSVPNEFIQEDAGQRQDRRGHESMGQASWQRVVTPTWLFDARGMVRDVSAELWSNALSTPIIAAQDRGFRETYLTASISGTYGRHSIKAGTETILTRVREQFGYRINDTNFFDEDFPRTFQFAGRQNGREHSVYAQDVLRLGSLTLSAGARYDSYRFLVSESFVSPRVAAAWHLRSAGLVLRASYDRAVTIPAIENLLLASSAAAHRLTEETTGLPVRPARANFFEAGFSKSLGVFRLDSSWYRRNIRDFADDDVFLNTGVSFPVSFDRARIQGFDSKLELPRWRRLSGFVSYSNLTGTGYLPITGGLFLDDDAQSLPSANTNFPITQDQRNTVQSRFRYELHRRVWMALGFWYNSGLPLEREEEDHLDEIDELEERYGAAVLSQVDLQRGRVRPSHAWDVSAGVRVWERERRTVTLQADALNVADRLNVINFAGLFSGTAIGAPRSVQFRLQAEF